MISYSHIILYVRLRYVKKIYLTILSPCIRVICADTLSLEMFLLDQVVIRLSLCLFECLTVCKHEERIKAQELCISNRMHIG